MSSPGMSSFEQLSRVAGAGSSDPGAFGKCETIFTMIKNSNEAAILSVLDFSKALQGGFGTSGIKGLGEMLFGIRSESKNPIGAIIADMLEQRAEGRLGITGEEFFKRVAAGAHDQTEGMESDRRAPAPFSRNASSGDSDGGGDTGSATGSNRPFNSIPALDPMQIRGGQDFGMENLMQISPSHGRGAARGIDDRSVGV